MGRQTENFEVTVLNNGEQGDHAARLSQWVQTQAKEDALNAAPTSATQRIWDVTKEGIKKIPEGFVHSLNPDHILPNVGAGFVIGAATKLLLPSGGPVLKVATGLMAGYFLGKPMYDTYSKAVGAKTMQDMDIASSMFGDTVGGLPVGMAEGAIGAKLGTGLAGAALSTRAGASFLEWKGNQYAKLDTQVNSGLDGLQNLAYERLGIGGPVMRSGGTRTGIVPPYVLEELARRNPSNPDFLDTIKKTEAMSLKGAKIGDRAVEQNFEGAREVYDAQGQEGIGVKARTEGQPKTGNAEVDAVYDYTGDVRNLYKEVHNRNSIDGRGMKMESTVNYGQNYENAFWDGSRMTYGRPGPDSPFRTFVLRDVTGHEITHGVTEYESGLVYRGQSGALNEHLSDVYGALVEQRVKGQSANDASWLVGENIWKEGIKGRALRDMQNPGTAYDDVAAGLGKDPQPAHMKDYINTRRDNGGVHLNSGIPNRAFTLFSKDVGGYAWEKPAQIWYKARANAGSSPSFAQFAYQTLEAAKQLGYTAEVPKLQKAWSDVGIKPSLTDTGAVPEGSIIPIITDADQKRAS